MWVSNELVGLMSYMCCIVFFKQKTAYEMRISDWSSDVCSSDLLDGLHRCGRAAVGGLERGREDLAAVLDVGAALGEAAVQVGVDADDLAHRPLTGVLVRSLLKPHAEGVDQVPLERGVVGLRGRDDRLVQRPAVDGQPLAVERLDLIRHGDVRMQVRVSGTGVPVGERRGDRKSTRMNSSH